MMQIEHVAMYVHDLEAAKNFYTRYLGAVAGELYHNESTGFRSYFLTFGGGCRLELMTRPGMDAAGGIPPCVGYHHLAFSLGSREKVDSLTARLRADGYEVVSGPRTTGDGCYESCIVAVEGTLMELTE